MSPTDPYRHVPPRRCRFATRVGHAAPPDASVGKIARRLARPRLSHTRLGHTRLSHTRWVPRRFAVLRSAFVWAALALACFAASGVPGFADTVEDFEGPDPSWSLAESDCQAELVAHQRRLSGARTGQGCEYLQIRHGQGSAVHITHPIDPSPIIAEWSPTVWVKSDAPGIQLMARVVLPRTRDPQTGRPLTTLLHGDSYRQRTLWQPLTIDQPTLRLERQIRTLRSQWGPNLDARQAYVDLLVLNVYSGGGIARILIDDLEVRGHVELPVVGDPRTRPALPLTTGIGAASPNAASWNAASRNAASSGQNAATPQSAATATREVAQASYEAPIPRHLMSGSQSAVAASSTALTLSPDVRMQGGLLTVRDRPILPRAALWRGEPFDWLADLGFNTLVLADFPAPQQIAEARRLGLWLIAPPPALPPAPSSSAPSTASSQVVWTGDLSAFPPCDRILAWSLGAELPASRERAERRAADAKRLPRELRRPLWGCANQSLARWSRMADLLATNAWRAADIAEANEGPFESAASPAYGLAPVSVARVDIAPISLDTVLPGRPVWADLHLPGLHTPSTVGLDRLPDQPRYDDRTLTEIRGTLYRAVSDGVRGVLFRAPDTLEPGRPELRPLLSTLRTLNAELALLEPWLSASNGVDEAVCRADGYQVRVLHNERARLAIVLASSRRVATDESTAVRVDNSFSRSTKPLSRVAANTPLSFIDPGATNGMEAYAITPNGLRPVSRRRVAGGVEVTLDNMPSFALVALTQEPLVVNYLTRRLASGRGSPTFQDRLNKDGR